MAKHTFSIVSLLLITPMMYGVETKSPGTMLEKALDKVTGPNVSAQLENAASGIMTTVQDELHSVEQRVIGLDPNILFHVAVGLAALEGCKMIYRYMWTPKDPIYAHAEEVLNPGLKRNVDDALSRVPKLNDLATKEEVEGKLDGIRKHFAGLVTTHGTRHDSADAARADLEKRLVLVEGKVVTAGQDMANLKAAVKTNTDGLAGVMTILHGAEKKPGIVARVVALEKNKLTVEGTLAGDDGKMHQQQLVEPKGNQPKGNESKGGGLLSGLLHKSDHNNNNNAGAGSSKDH